MHELRHEVEQTIRRFGGYTDRTADFHERVQEALQLAGWNTQREVPVTYSPNRNDGRIDLVARRGARTVAIECDNRSPRRRSFVKLAAYECDARLIVLRRPAASALVGKVAVIGVEVQT